MTMDIANQIRANQSEKSSTTLKRSFDVAFLMMPDERLKQKQQPEKFIRVDESPERDESPKPQLVEYLNNNGSQSPKYTMYPQITIRSKVYDDVSELSQSPPVTVENPKSAFTKVARLESPVPPLSPDQLSCPSISPPISTTPPRTNMYQYQFQQSAQNLQVLQNQHRIKQQLMYRQGNPTPSPEHLIPGYPGFPFGNGPNPFIQQPDIPGMPRNPAAAAILSTLIPPTLASTFTLTAQNICAKCNISFRMTSDLVYHMRSHHKSEVACDPGRRKREDKLKCPVCNESFRERHHLTRHMTAHQDKESDSQQPEVQPLDVGHIQSIHQDMSLGRRTK